MSSPERLAVASITGLVEAHAARGRLTADQAAAEIRAELERRVPGGRRAEVLGQSAAAYVDGDQWYAAAALKLLVDLGADFGRARAIRVERAGRRHLTIGDAQL